MQAHHRIEESRMRRSQLQHRFHTFAVDVWQENLGDACCLCTLQHVFTIIGELLTVEMTMSVYEHERRKSLPLSFEHLEGHIGQDLLALLRESQCLEL